MTIQVRRLSGDDWEAFRALRLAALQDSPDAFGSTYEGERDLPETHWRARTATTAAGFLDDVPAGLVGWFIADQEPDTLHMVSMWVAPDARRRGIGRALVAEVLHLAKELDVERVGLYVVTTNTDAAALYTQMGFKRGGPDEPMGEKPHILEYRMYAPIRRWA